MNETSRTSLEPSDNLNSHITTLDTEQQQRLLKELNVGIIIHSSDTSIIYSNPAASRILELSAEELRGKAAHGGEWKMLRADGTEMPAAEYPVNLIAASLKSLSDYVIGYDAPKTLERKWVKVHAYPELLSNGQLIHIVVTFIDITESETVRQL